GRGGPGHSGLAGHGAATAIEAVSPLPRPATARSLRQSRQAAALAQARTCYDHLAGQAGVALLDALLAGRVLAGNGLAPAGTAPQAQAGAAALDVTAAGGDPLAAVGVEWP